MRCPECQSTHTKIFDSRMKGERKWRRHECPNGHRFTTWEMIVEPTAEDVHRAVTQAVVQVLPDLIDRITALITENP